MAEFTPVSYTHLDVYKRQDSGNNEAIENIAMIASYIAYLMNLEENKSPQLSDALSLIHI